MIGVCGEDLCFQSMVKDVAWVSKGTLLGIQCGEGTSLGCLVCVLLGRYVMVYEHLFLGSCVGGRAKSR